MYITQNLALKIPSSHDHLPANSGAQLHGDQLPVMLNENNAIEVRMNPRLGAPYAVGTVRGGKRCPLPPW